MKIIMSSSESGATYDDTALKSAKMSYALQLVNEEFIDNTILSRMTISDVIKLRTVAWGKQQEKRRRFIESMHTMIKDDASQSDIDSFIKSQLEEYRILSNEVENERRRIKYRTVSKMIDPDWFMNLPVVGSVAGLALLTQVSVSASLILMLVAMKYGSLKFENRSEEWDIINTELALREHLSAEIFNFFGAIDDTVSRFKFSPSPNMR